MIKKVRLAIFKNWLKILVFIFFIPSLILNVLLYQKIQKINQKIMVIGVIDGDTLVLEGKVRLRLKGVDAPELQFCGGQEAKNFLEQLTVGKKITLEEKIIDQQGRAMALVYAGKTLINLEMIKSGWVRYHSDGGRQAKKLKEAADLAKNQNKGIFSSLCYQKENPDNPDCNIKGNIDKNSGFKKYYFPGCAQYSFTIVEKDIGEQWFCSPQEAEQAGFSKAETCP